MKTWTNPTVEELEVALTAAWLVACSPESWNGELELGGGQIVVGGGNCGGNNENEGGEGGVEEGGDIIIGQGS